MRCGARALAQVKSLQEDAKMYDQKFRQELDYYKDEVAALSKDRAAVEDELRREFGRQLKDILAERQVRYG